MTELDRNNFMRTMKILHLALIVGPTLFLLISVFLIESGNWDAGLKNYADKIFIGLILLAAGVVVLSRHNFNKSLNTLKSNGESAENNLDKYRGMLISRWATIEFATLLTIILFFMTSSYYLLFLAVALLIYAYTLRPDSAKISDDLGITIME
jgi:MFS family permease